MPTTYVLIVIWPVGSLLLFFSLALRCRRRLISRAPDAFLRATKFLHGDFLPEYFFWATVELAVRSFVTGFVMLIPAEKSFVRTMVSLVFSLVALVVTLTACPYRRSEDNTLAVASMLMLVFTFLGAIVIKVFEEFSASDLELTRRVLGFGSVEGFVGMLIGCTVLMLIVVLGAALYSLRTEHSLRIWRLKDTKAPPVLSRESGHKWMLFLSHIWSTGQDQNAAIKLQLQLMLPQIPIFLDVDDLEDTAALERYVAESAVVNMFLSKGYLQSRNCLREVKAVVDQKKPYVFVHEANESKGGAPLDELKNELRSDELRAGLFDGRQATVWHRAAEFQLVTLRFVTEQLLLHSPAYAGRTELPLVMPGELIEEDLVLPGKVSLYASPANPGAFAAASELQERRPELFVTSTLPAAVKRVMELGDTHTSNGRTSANERMSAHERKSDRLASIRGLRRKPGDLAQSKGSSLSLLPGEATHFFLYLSSDTWSVTDGSGDQLAAEVRAVRSQWVQRVMPIVLVHENDLEKAGCEFDSFFHTTPTDLLNDNIYSDLAIALMSGKHREVSMQLLLKKLGAKRRSKRFRVLSGRADRPTASQPSASGPDQSLTLSAARPVSKYEDGGSDAQKEMKRKASLLHGWHDDGEAATKDGPGRQTKPGSTQTAGTSAGPAIAPAELSA